MSSFCHKKGGFESRMLSFHENNIMSKQKENKIPLACETQICHYKKQVSSQIDHPSHIRCAFLVCLYECVCVCVAYVVYVCVLCII